MTRLGLPSLELRRLHLDLLYCYKIVFGSICHDVNRYFTFTSLSTRWHPYKLYKAQCENLKRCNFFTERIVNVWNSLPANVDFSSLLRSISHSSLNVMFYNYSVCVPCMLLYVFCVFCVFVFFCVFSIKYGHMF